MLRVSITGGYKMRGLTAGFGMGKSVTKLAMGWKVSGQIIVGWKESGTGQIHVAAERERWE